MGWWLRLGHIVCMTSTHCVSTLLPPTLLACRYGELGNADLVSKYGFALRQNPFTAVGLSKAELLEAAARLLGSRQFRQRCRLLREQTDVLDDEEEPFEVCVPGEQSTLQAVLCACMRVMRSYRFHAAARRLQALPNGHISPALFVALRVLCAPDDEAARWGGISDALQPPPASEEQQEQELGAVQVWPVLDAGWQPLAPAEAAAQAAAAALQGRHCALLNSAMCTLLHGAVERRLSRYAASLQHDLQLLLEEEEGGGRPGGNRPAPTDPEGDREVTAHRAALLLRIGEKEVLQQLQVAAAARLAALEQAATAAAATALQPTAAAAPKGRKRKQT